MIRPALRHGICQLVLVAVSATGVRAASNEVVLAAVTPTGAVAI